MVLTKDQLRWFPIRFCRPRRQLIERCVERNIHIGLCRVMHGGSNRCEAAMTACRALRGLLIADLLSIPMSAKEQDCGYLQSLLEHHGAIVKPVAIAMAEGAPIAARGCAQSRIVSRAAPPGPLYRPAKPVGLVTIAVFGPVWVRDWPSTKARIRTLTRDEVREKAVSMHLTTLALRCLDR